MLAYLDALAHHFASLLRHLGANMCNNSKQNAVVEPTSSKTAPRCLRHPFQAPQEYNYTSKTLTNIARYHGKIYGNISLNSGISWGLAAPRPPRGFPRVLGP